jgi:hypothetical protein
MPGDKDLLAQSLRAQKAAPHQGFIHQHRTLVVPAQGPAGNNAHAHRIDEFMADGAHVDRPGWRRRAGRHRSRRPQWAADTEAHHRQEFCVARRFHSRQRSNALCDFLEKRNRAGPRGRAHGEGQEMGRIVSRINVGELHEAMD